MAGLSREERFAATHQKSRALWERAMKVSRGFHTDPILVRPFSIYITHGKGSRKWDVDGNEYIDYLMGFGALLLGHAHPAMVEAVQKQIVKGTHYGGENELELEWAEKIHKLIPCAEKVEFTLSGSEADMLIARLARAYTGRSKILKFAEHYFGWAEDVLAGIAPPYDKPFAGQIPPFTKGVIGGGAVWSSPAMTSRRWKKRWPSGTSPPSSLRAAAPTAAASVSGRKQSRKRGS